ncbi:TetR/AcrR family transcriptional regulator [Paractinoplanes durhamensis]|uniref:TetR family transcriptional regulator n=1 Tax=Paractinoplanes durhamensis TaxID=113563 RepID=A0ABQ3YQY7_9ACTN|nr:TetR/AcrR family transcriptional regulator [Actinoplanes durhamensis]GIE00001.1 TetR family transcriptional regulator [Actinoplanes durhamensis]
MTDGRRDELLTLAYAYVRDHGLSDLTLRPLAAAIGTSPRVLLFLFESKEGLVKALLARARADELALLSTLGDHQGLPAIAEAVWGWLSDATHRPLLRLWFEAYARSVDGDQGPWAGFAEGTVADWLAVLATADDDPVRCTAVLALLRGALLDLLATGDVARTTAAVRRGLRAYASPVPEGGR